MVKQMSSNTRKSSVSDSHMKQNISMETKRVKKRKQVGNDECNHPLYIGVRMRNCGKWVSEIRLPKTKTRIWLGTFRTPEMAARAHDVAAITIKGKKAILNFPELISSLPRPASTSPRDVQEAAAKAAAMENLGELKMASKDSYELSEIVELPNLGACCEDDTVESSYSDKFVFLDSLDDGGCLYTPLWMQNV